MIRMSRISVSSIFTQATFLNQGPTTHKERPGLYRKLEYCIRDTDMKNNTVDICGNYMVVMQ